MDDRPGLSEAAWAAMSSPTRLAVLLLCETGAFTVVEIAQELDLKRPVTWYHVQGLEAAGLVREADRVRVPGHPLKSYTATCTGWAAIVGQLNEIADSPLDS